MITAAHASRPRWAVLAAGALALSLVSVGPITGTAAGDAATGSAGPCPGASGVTVVVDFGELGGGVQVRCAPGSPTTGIDALNRAGFSYGFVPQKGPFVCQIDDRPDRCNGAPADAYWAYWHADRGGGWEYSSEGAASREPRAGSVDGWAFGDSAAPSVAPPDRPDPTTTAPKPTTTIPPAPADDHPPDAGADATPPDAAPPADAPSRGAVADEATPAPADDGPTRARPGDDPAPRRIEVVAPAAASAPAGDGEGSAPVAALGAVVVIVTLGTLGLREAGRRARAE